MCASELGVRDALDAAVRCLAVGADPLPERLRAAGTIVLDRLSPTDFSDAEDRELFDQIRIALTKLTPRARHDALSATVHAMSEVMAEQIASDILDLRDTALGRAIYGRNAFDGIDFSPWPPRRDAR